MFGLEKLKFQTKLIIISVIIIMFSMGIVYIRNITPITVVKIDDWVFVTANEEGSWYYKSNSMYIDDQSHSVTGWVKFIYTDQGKQAFLKTHKDDKYRDIVRSLYMIEIDYQKLEFKEIRVVYYSNSDNIIGSEELPIKIDGLIPKSVGDKLLVKILKGYNIKR